MDLTNTQEEYLKTIYFLSKTKPEIRVTDIAENMQKTKASTNSAIKALKELGLVSYQKYGPIQITEVGREEAHRIVAANNVVKLFLKEIINVDDKNVEDEAAKIKTILSKDSLNKLLDYTYNELKLRGKI